MTKKYQMAIEYLIMKENRSAIWRKTPKFACILAQLRLSFVFLFLSFVFLFLSFFCLSLVFLLSFFCLSFVFLLSFFCLSFVFLLSFSFCLLSFSFCLLWRLLYFFLTPSRLLAFSWQAVWLWRQSISTSPGANCLTWFQHNWLFP